MKGILKRECERRNPKTLTPNRAMMALRRLVVIVRWAKRPQRVAGHAAMVYALTVREARPSQMDM